MKIAVTRDALDGLRAEAQKAAPDECCGLLLGHQGVIDRVLPAVNVADDPRARFEIDPGTLIAALRAARGGGPAVIGYYHSHPQGAPEPSPCDAEQAARDGKVWAIVGGDGAVRLWEDGHAGFMALSYGVIER